jgi:hypothetical protein
MKVTTTVCCIGILLATSAAQASDVGFNLNLNIGNRRPVYGVPVVPAPAFMIPAPPVFLAPPGLGFSVAIDIPYDMVHIDGAYYVYHGDTWHRGSHYNGPWTPVRHEHLPYGLRKHKRHEIISYRDREYRHYREHDHRDNYRGRVYRPVENRDRDRDWKRDKGNDRGKGKSHHYRD